MPAHCAYTTVKLSHCKSAKYASFVGVVFSVLKMPNMIDKEPCNVLLSHYVSIFFILHVILILHFNVRDNAF